ncbi:MAG: RNA recognition motif domain-containing protein [Desulfovibrionales bacterium]
MKKIYIGNLPLNTREERVRSLFESIGPVFEVELFPDGETGEPQGFGMVCMDDAAAERAVLALNGKRLEGYRLRVDFGGDPETEVLQEDLEPTN